MCKVHASTIFQWFGSSPESQPSRMGLLIAWAIGDHFMMTGKFPALVLLHPARGGALLKLTYQRSSFHRPANSAWRFTIYHLLPWPATHLELFFAYLLSQWTCHTCDVIKTRCSTRWEKKNDSTLQHHRHKRIFIKLCFAWLLHLLLSDYVTMPPKPKRLRSPKKGLKTKSKRKMQPPPDPVSSDGFATEEDEPTL